MKRRPRRLHPEEAELWRKVKATATPLHPAGPKPVKPPEEPAPPAAEAPPRARTPVEPFEIGQRAGETAPPPETSARPGRRPADSAPRMDRKAFVRMSRGRIDPEARIDLHGMTQDQAHGALVGFIARSHRQGMRLVLVITGKGRGEDDDGPIPRRPGILRRAVPQWLRGAPLGPMVLEVRQAHRRHGGEGAYYVYLRRAR
ncbi:DNA mismatch repair protein MutS [Rhodobacteraceae bacterium WD3A24]|nr:DNA mismatch repair protein MutS [Rhodobacteraceae bacterium WD3A24]